MIIRSEGEEAIFSSSWENSETKRDFKEDGGGYTIRNEKDFEALVSLSSMCSKDKKSVDFIKEREKN
jgi:hypothetical protein